MPTSPPGDDAEGAGVRTEPHSPAPPRLIDVARAAWLPLALLGACWAFAGLLPDPGGSVWELRLALYGSVTFVFLLTAWFISALVPLALHRGARLAWAAAALLALAMIGNVLELHGFSDAAKIAFGAVTGLAIARLVEQLWWLLPICVLVPLADAWSVFSSKGVTNAVVEKAKEDPTWIRWPTVAVPIAGIDYLDAPRIGIVDFLFVAVFLTVAWNFHLGMRRGVLLLPLGFVATYALIFEGIVGLAIPALPLLCLAFLLVYGRPMVHDAGRAWRRRIDRRRG